MHTQTSRIYNGAPYNPTLFGLVASLPFVWTIAYALWESRHDDTP